MNLKVLLCTLVLIASSAQAASSVTCKLTSTKNKSISAVLPLSAIDKNGAESSGAGLDIGKDNHSFYMELAKEKTDIRLDVIFYENNNVQDEVGSISCKFKANAAPSVICQEPLYSDGGKLVAKFACTKN